MAERRRYTRKTKATAVIAAAMSSVSAAAEASGIPRKTLEYWVEAPEFAELRQKTRTELAEGSIVLAHLAQAELTRKIRAGEVEPRDLATIYGIAIDKGQLLAGEATNRTESRDLTNTMDDHEREALRKVLDEVMVDAGS
jgi:hypothetical protein